MPLLRRLWRWLVSKVEAAVPETPEGYETLAGAICCLAAGAHSKNPAEQEQIAATFFNLAMTGFEGVRPDDAVKAFVTDMMKRVQKP